MLYRIDKQKEIVTKGNYEISKISKKISKLWKNEKIEIKKFYKEKYENSKLLYLIRIKEYKKKVAIYLEEKSRNFDLKKKFEKKKNLENFCKKEKFLVREKKIRKKKKKIDFVQKNKKFDFSEETVNSNLENEKFLEEKKNFNFLKKKKIPNLIYFLSLISFE